MDNKHIRYVAFYTHNKIMNENRQSALSAATKIEYVANALVENNYSVEIVSPSWSNNTSGFYTGKVNCISNNITLKTFNSFGAKRRFFKMLKYLYSLFQLFLYLIFNVSEDETILVYHSMMISAPIRLARFFKNFNIILEIEEIYQDIQSFSKAEKISEYKLINSADGYIFSTELLEKKINSNNKPYIVLYGTYKVEKNRSSKFQDNKIHVVYAGTFDSRKGGAALSVAAAEYLPSNYHMHIIGFGNSKDTKTVTDLISEISKKTEATITYDGLLSGEEYIQFLQKCDIGLSTQIPEAAYNETSFPSKILSYMANGLRVVSIRIKAIEISEVGQAVYYYEEPNPESIANAIISIDLNKPHDSRELIRRLDVNFTENIKKLLEV